MNITDTQYEQLLHYCTQRLDSNTVSQGTAQLALAMARPHATLEVDGKIVKGTTIVEGATRLRLAQAIILTQQWREHQQSLLKEQAL